MERPGKVIRARREALAMSQEQLAWLSGVSRTTIRNIEADRVEEARTWNQVERALGWRPGSLDEIKAGEYPAEILPQGALALIVKAILRRHETVINLKLSLPGIYRDMSRRRDDRETISDKTIEERAEEKLTELRGRLDAQRADLVDFRGNYLMVLKSLAMPKRTPSERSVDWIYPLLAHVQRDLGPDDTNKLVRILHQELALPAPQDESKEEALSPWGGVPIARKLTRRVVERRLERGESPISSKAGGVNSSDHLIVISVRVPGKNLEELDQEDVAWITGKLGEMAITFTEAIAESKQRERAKRLSEMQAELPGLEIDHIKRG